MPARDAHRALELVDGADEHALGLAPQAELAEQRGLHGVAMVADQDRDAGPVTEQPAAAQHVDPGGGAVEVASEVAGGEERAHRLAGDLVVVRGAAGEGHRLVEQSHALLDPSGLHVGEARVGQRLRLEVDIAETTGPVQGEGGVGEENVRVVDIASERRDRHPPLLEARRLVLDQPPGPDEPGAGRRVIPEEVGEQPAEASAGHRRATVVADRGQLTDGHRKVARRCLAVEPGERLLCQLERPDARFVLHRRPSSHFERRRR
ncbi:MAG: hypothetical protein M3356_00135 [Actinomycetota bacterium]|nr:hypothetical protein [Actinomycetota bacterium]